MHYDPKQHHRQTIRLQQYPYLHTGSYFITLCAYERQCLFGEIKDEKMKLNELGLIVEEEWIKSATIRKTITVDEFVVMPNHLHGILVMSHDDTPEASCKYEQFGQPVSGSIPTIIRAFKAVVTRRINQIRNSPGVPVWQRNYYEHVIRDDESMRSIQEYIINNPLSWALDELNPLAKRNH